MGNTGSMKRIVAGIDLSTRKKRRMAVTLVIALLEKIRVAEELNMERFPLNLQGGPAYAAADDSLDALIDVICALSEAYE